MPLEEYVADVVLDLKSELGEGAFWCDDTQRLLWIDILGQKLHVFNPDDNVLYIWLKFGWFR